MIRAGIIIAAVAAGLTALAVHMAGSRLPLIMAGAAAGLLILMAAGFALLRGAVRHSVVAWSPQPRVRQDDMLPPPGRPQPAVLPAARPDPFTADGVTWAELVEQAEREELLRQGPREARVIAPRCEGPGCPSVLDKNPWRVLAETDGHTAEHSFCSGECAEEWRREDAAAGAREGY